MESNYIKVFSSTAGINFPKSEGGTAMKLKSQKDIPLRNCNSDTVMISPKQVITAKYLCYLIETKRIPPKDIVDFNNSFLPEVKSQLNNNSKKIDNDVVPQDKHRLTTCTLINADNSLPMNKCKCKDDYSQTTLGADTLQVQECDNSIKSLKSIKSRPLFTSNLTEVDHSQPGNSSENSLPLFTSFTIGFDKCEVLKKSQNPCISVKPRFLLNPYPLKIDNGADNAFPRKTRPILASRTSQVKEDGSIKSTPKLAKPRPLFSSTRVVDEIENHAESELDPSGSYVELHVQKLPPTLMKLYDSLETYNPNKLTNLYVHKSVPRKIKAYHSYARDKNGCDTYTILNVQNLAHCEMTRYNSSSSSRCKSEVVYINKASPTKMKVNNRASPISTPYFVSKEYPLKMEVPVNWDRSRRIYFPPTILPDNNYYEYLPAIGGDLKVRIKLQPDAKKQ